MTNARREPVASDLLQRTIYDAQGKLDLPGKVVRKENGAPASDRSVNEAYDGLGLAFTFFQEVFERASIDGKGLPLEAAVHYGRQFCNAVWNGKMMVFGDGDGEIFNRFTKVVDVLFYEYAKAIVIHETVLENWGQAGSLISSIADVLSASAKQWMNQQTVAEADWLIAPGLFAKRVKARGLRSLKAPGTAYDDERNLGKDLQIAHMDQYREMDSDNGGVHINSGIPNLAFYNVAMKIGGHAWEAPARIWYESMLDKRLLAKAEFRDFARLTLANSSRLYGSSSAETSAVKEGWEAVGIRVARG